MSRLKYMGTADIRRIEKGDDFGGRLADGGLEKTVEFSADNKFIVDTEELGLSEDSVALLLTQPDIKDVSDLKRIPLNQNQKIFGGQVDEVEPVSSDGVADGPGTSGGAAPTTTAGGSTRGGRGGGSTSGGGSTTTTGGSTAGSA